MDAWPTTLPQEMLIGGFGDVLADNVITDGYNVGPPAYRRRSTAGPQPFGGSMVMTTAEWESFRTFFQTTLADGALRFLFPPQGTSDHAHFWIARFVSPPSRQISEIDDTWIVQLDLERLGVGKAFLFPQRLRNRSVFYSPHLIYDQFLVAARYNDVDTFRTHTIIGAGSPVGITPNLFSQADAFYIATVTRVGGPTQPLTASLYTDADSFFAPTVTIVGGGGEGAWAASAWGEA